MSDADTTQELTCAECSSKNPVSNKFCGNCGSGLGTTAQEVEAYLRLHLGDRLDKLLKERVRDQSVVETEIAINASEKVSTWMKVYGLYVGLPLIAASAFLLWQGYDFNRSFEKAKNSINEAQTSSDVLKAQINNLQTSVQAVNSQYSDLRSSIDTLSAHLSPGVATAVQLRPCLHFESLGKFSNACPQPVSLRWCFGIDPDQSEAKGWSHLENTCRRGAIHEVGKTKPGDFLIDVDKNAVPRSPDGIHESGLQILDGRIYPKE